MKIKNVEKFRNELYEAIAANYLNTEAPACTWKGGNEYKEIMNEINTHTLDGTAKCVSLAKPLLIRDLGLAITVDAESGDVDVYDITKPEEFVFKGWVTMDLYKTKMAYAIAVTQRLELVKTK